MLTLAVSSVSRGVDHQAEAHRSGLQGELLAGQSLQVRPEEIPLQRRLQHAPSPRSPPVLPAALSGVCCASRWSHRKPPVGHKGPLNYWLLAELSVCDSSVHTSNLLTLIASCSSLMVTITRSHDLVKNRKKILRWMFEKSERIHLHMKESPLH